MSDVRAIHAVTQTLAWLLGKTCETSGLIKPEITTTPPDRARNGEGKNQLNLYLYQTTINPVWRNADPRGIAPPPVGLTLHYLLTTYSAGLPNTDQELLAVGWRMIHDHPVLGKDILAAHEAVASNLADQIERVRITAQPMSLEELSKLWMMFQTPYRLSLAFEASVVLIDSAKTATSALPVLRQGSLDRGPLTLTTKPPMLEGLELPNRQPAVRIGETFKLRGQHLAATDLKVRLESPAHVIQPPAVSNPPAVIDLTILEHQEDQLLVKLEGIGLDTTDLSQWVPGFYTVTAVTSLIADHPISSNALALPIAPKIESLNATKTATGTVNLEVTCSPRIRTSQRVMVLFGDQQVAASPITIPGTPQEPSRLSFKLGHVKAGTYTVRLRVDGVESLPIKSTNDTTALLEFDPKQQVTVS
jgi:Pvc16 N-terminal domain